MADDFITPDFVEQTNKSRGSNTRRGPSHGTQHMNNQENSSSGNNQSSGVSNFFQENKTMIIIGAIALIIILVLVFWVMTREKKDASKRPAPGNQNMPPPGYNGPPGPQRGPPPPGYGGPTIHQNTPPTFPQNKSQEAPLANLPPVKNLSKPAVTQPESVIETADDNEVNKYMNIGANDDEPVSSDEEEEVQKKDNVDFANLDEYDSDGDN